MPKYDQKICFAYEGEDPRGLDLSKDDLADYLDQLLALDYHTPEAYAEELTKKLIDCYPENRHPKNAQSIVYAIIDEFKNFAPYVCRDAVKQVTRTVKAFPTVADVYDACEKLKTRHGELCDGAWAIWDEYERREDQEEQVAEQEKKKAEEEKQKAEEKKNRRQQRRLEFKCRTQEILTRIELDAIKHFGDAIKPGMMMKIMESLAYFNEWDEDRITKDVQAIWDRLVLVSKGDAFAFEIYKRGSTIIAKANDTTDPSKMYFEALNTMNCETVYNSLPLEVTEWWDYD